MPGVEQIWEAVVCEGRALCFREKDVGVQVLAETRGSLCRAPGWQGEAPGSTSASRKSQWSRGCGWTRRLDCSSVGPVRPCRGRGFFFRRKEAKSGETGGKRNSIVGALSGLGGSRVRGSQPKTWGWREGGGLCCPDMGVKG